MYNTVAQLMVDEYETRPMARDGALVALWALNKAIEIGHCKATLKKEYEALTRARMNFGVPVVTIPFGHPCF